MLSVAELSRRMKGIGSSDIAAIAGLSPHRRPIDVYSEKLGYGSSVDPDAEHIMLGNHLESGLAAHYAWKTKSKIIEVGIQEHPEYPWMIATPDRVAVDDRGVWVKNVEIKTAGPWVAKNWGKGSDEIPEAYICQAAWQMAVLGLPATDLVALVGGEFRIYALVRDEQLEKDLVSLGQRFWEQHVLAEVPPPIDGSPSYSSFIKRAHPSVTFGTFKPKTPELEIAAEAYRLAREAMDASETRMREAQQRICTAIGEAEGIEGVATWRADKNGKRTFRIKEATNGN